MNRLFSKASFKVFTITALGCGVLKNFSDNSPTTKPHYAANYSRKFYPGSAEYPDFKKHRNIMARNLNENLYSKLRDLRTPNGFTIDDAIQTGVDNIGKFSTTGCVAGDEESYKVFRDLFDKVLYEKHGFKRDQRQQLDTDANNLKNAEFDPEFVMSIRIRTIRNISGYCFPSFCTRGERRDVESIIARALYDMNGNYNGGYYSLADLSDIEEASLANNNIFMERPYSPEELSACISRDWPDSRGIWLSADKSLSAYVNRNDHVLFSSMQRTSNLKEAFEKLYDLTKKFETRLNVKSCRVMKDSRLGYLTTDPKNLGTAMKLSVRIKLPQLSKDSRISALLKMFKLNQHYKVVSAEDPSILEVTSSRTMGKSEVEIAQDFIDSINTLISAEKKVASGEPLDSILYKD